MTRARVGLICVLLLLAACTRASSQPGPADGGHAGSGGSDAASDARSAGADAASRDAGARADAQPQPDAAPAADGGERDGGVGLDADAGDVCADPTHGFDGFDRSCTSGGDCVLAQRTLTCCGTQIVSAVNRSAAASFEAAATSCDARFPACGCASLPTQADDLTRVDDTHPYANAGCDSSQHCASSFAKSSATTPCGSNGLVCDARSQICVRREPVGPAIVYECKPVPPGCEVRRDCACAGKSLCTSGYDVCSDDAENSLGCVCPLCQ